VKKVEIILGGSGHEITRSKFTDDELNKVKSYCKENDEDIESVLTNNLEDVLEDRGMWYDCDDLGHFMGGNLGCKIYVTINDDEFEFETGDATVELSNEHSWPKFSGGTMVSFVTWEKGTMDSCDFEINDDEDFDIKKLKLKALQIETPENIYEIISELTYDGEPLNGDGFGDTTGKAFDIEIG
tara:strand:+ start:1576 stop:2127 length:552 start_codon:yes stop_codon:yes gene_type:complete